VDQQAVYLWQGIRDALKREIKSGALPEGSRLPSDIELAERFGVNRHTIRRALSEMRSEGLVRAERGKGTFVNKQPLGYKLGPRSRFTENLLDNQRLASRDILETQTLLADRHVARNLKIGVGEIALLSIQLGKADGIALSLAHAYFPESRTPGLLPILKRERSITRALAEVGVVNYRRKWARIGARMPTTGETQLLAMEKGEPVLIYENVDVDVADLPIKYTSTVIRSSRLDFTIDFDELIHETSA